MVYTNVKDERLYDVVINIEMETLKSIVKPNEDDPLLYDRYVLDAVQLDKLGEYALSKINIDFSTYYYVLECSGIYG